LQGSQVSEKIFFVNGHKCIFLHVFPPNPQVVDLVTSGFMSSAFFYVMTTHPVYPDPQEMTPLGGEGSTHLFVEILFSCK